ncbi:hypothetical protein R0K18_34730, partial [Pantoea sp. SIMBA_133]
PRYLSPLQPSFPCICHILCYKAYKKTGISRLENKDKCSYDKAINGEINQITSSHNIHKPL